MSQLPLVKPDGNYSSPALEALCGVWADFQELTADRQEVVRVIENVDRFVTAQIKEMETAAESPDVDTFDPARVSILQSFFEHQSALSQMKDALSEGAADNAAVESALGRIQIATNQMALGFQSLGSGSDVTDDFALVIPTTSLTTPNYVEIAEAFTRWRVEPSQGKSEFLQTLADVRDRLAEQHELTDQLAEQAESEIDSEEELEPFELVIVAVERCVETLDAMMEAVEKDSILAVDDLFATFAEATVELLKAQEQTGRDDDEDEELLIDI